MAHIFISYARSDGSDYALRLDSELPRHGFNTWRDKRGIDPSQDFTAEIERAIEKAAFLVTCVTQDVRRDNSFVRREIAYAQILKKPIIVARFADVPPPISVINHTWLDFFSGWDTAFRNLVNWFKSTQRDQPSDDDGPAGDDPYRDYLEALYLQTVRYLDRTVFANLPGDRRTPLINLSSTVTPDAVDADNKPVSPLANVFGKGNKRTDYRSIAEAFDDNAGRLLLLGEPGSGKTITLVAFARDVIAHRLEDPSAPLPLLAFIATWDAERQPTMADWLKGVIPMLGDDIDALIQGGEALLLLDGLDELGEERESQARDERFDPRKRFMALLPENGRVIVTSRSQDYDAIGEKIGLEGAITLAPLTDAQVQRYLSDLPSLWQALNRDDELKELARTPLLLSLFAYAYADLEDELHALHHLDGGDLRDRIFSTYVERRYQHEAQRSADGLRFSLEQIYALLGKMAAQDVVGYQYGAPDNVFVDADIQRAVSVGAAESFRDLMLHLQLWAEIQDGTYRFVHALMRDYFAFQFASDPASIDAYPYAYRALERLRDPRALDMLLAIASDPPSDKVFVEVVRALRFIPHPQVDEFLLSRVEDDHAEVRELIVNAFGYRQTPQAVPLLIAAVEDSHPIVRGRAVEALGRLRVEEAIDVIASRLDDRGVMSFSFERGEVTVAMMAADALRRIGTPAALANLSD